MYAETSSHCFEPAGKLFPQEQLQVVSGAEYDLKAAWTESIRQVAPKPYFEYSISLLAQSEPKPSVYCLIESHYILSLRRPYLCQVRKLYVCAQVPKWTLMPRLLFSSSGSNRLVGDLTTLTRLVGNVGLITASLGDILAGLALLNGPDLVAGLALCAGDFLDATEIFATILGVLARELSASHGVEAFVWVDTYLNEVIGETGICVCCVIGVK